MAQPAPLPRVAPSPTVSQKIETPAPREVPKRRHAGSRVWSELRGAIKAVGRTSQAGTASMFMPVHVRYLNNIGSEISTPVDLAPTNTEAVQDHTLVGEPLVRAKTEPRIGSSSSRSQGNKGSTTRDFVRKLKQIGLPSNGTALARIPPGRRGSSVYIPPNVQSATSSEQGSTPLTDRSVTEGYSTEKTSTDSRTSVLTNGKSMRRPKRRLPWTQSSPDFSLCTIAESGTERFEPTIATVERAAAAKVYLEVRLNEKLYLADSRARRMRHLEAQLYYSPHLREGEKDIVRSGVLTQESCHLRELRVLEAKSEAAARGTIDASPFLDHYEPVRVLGKGSFGVVKLVREKNQDQSAAQHKQVYAMKIIRKSEMLRNSQEGHLRAERDFLVASEHAEWVVTLMCSFQDAANLYLVMEYMPGGDFLGLLVRENILVESVACFYIAEMILAVEETHRLKFIHRDIKPDNFLISATGHLKISDFGLAFDGHWSHDLSYYNYHRYSLCKKLNLDLAGDETDRKERRDTQKQVDRNRMF
ncbi:uncharacterized protein J7T54_006031 [Emericellopsis cladophorae]|uniref:non-specific serine/threonine protein kinase n=1 Tax=Emericellopsis cladophorae TaxID=2686198 RepID=A0A9P9Y8Y5_9HYPO|nr:uncharacterized protein J7T54_006031 [Emericellopsis cladophorae]KAI6785697.1 hypothetical protein J7T54_006031 [Emericellopsis cladophorae]